VKLLATSRLRSRLRRTLSSSSAILIALGPRAESERGADARRSACSEIAKDAKDAEERQTTTIEN
jgi:hypothetical protein